MNEDKICRDGDGGRNLGEQLIHTLVASPSLVDHLSVTLKHGERDVMEERPEHFGPPEKHTVPRGVSGHWALTAVCLAWGLLCEPAATRQLRMRTSGNGSRAASGAGASSSESELS